jgi:hypothetical protein
MTRLLMLGLGVLLAMPTGLQTENAILIFVPMVVNPQVSSEIDDEHFTPLPDDESEFGWSVITRLRPVGQGDQTCTGGSHQIVVTVLDAAGRPLNGVRAKEVFTGGVKLTGDSGPGRAVWDIYRGGGGQVQLVDHEDEPLSPASAGMRWEAGYCDCKPHPDAASCEEELNNKTYLFAVGHYTYEVVFYQRYVPLTLSQASCQMRRVESIQLDSSVWEHLPR